MTISEYVVHNMYETINKVEAYLNSVHVSGKYDSLGREKPFPNIVIAASNIRFRATDIDRKDIKVKPTKKKDVIDAFVASVHIQDWMTKAKYGQFLNDWGRVLARYGSAVVKFVEKGNMLTITLIPWNRLICDAIDFENNPKIEVLELTEAQLRKNGSYNQKVVKALCEARTARKTIGGRRKDNKNDYIRVYEIHGDLPLSYITGKTSDADIYTQQMQVVSFVAGKKRGEHDDFTLFSGREPKDPYMIAHLIKEEGRTLAIGAVEHLFQAQWMQNHTAKAIKDQLDVASKIVFQTADGTFLTQNVISSFENGDILIHEFNKPLTQMNNASHDVTSLMNFGAMFKSLGNEIAGVSDAMLGAAPKSGTAWRQTEAILQESYSLFELMTENKALAIEDQFREFIIPFIRRKKMNDSREIAATLDMYGISQIDAEYIKVESVKRTNKDIIKANLKGKVVTPEQQAVMMQSHAMDLKESMKGNKRFFKPSEISSKTWKEQFKDLEWELEVDITGENKDYKAALATLNTALNVMMMPGFDQNPKAQFTVGKILEASGYLSPLELSQIKSMPVPSPIQSTASGGSNVVNKEAAVS